MVALNHLGIFGRGEPVRFRTRLILILLFTATGAGTGYAWKANVFSRSLSGNEEPRVIKKQTAVKPKNLKQLAKEVVAAPKIRQDFTFFDTLDDVNLVRYVNLKGQVVEKPGKGTTPKIEEPQVPKFTTPQPPQTIPAPEIAKPLEPKIKKFENLDLLDLVKAKEVEKGKGKSGVVLSLQKNIFRVQVSSFRESNMARSLEAHLKNKGYPAFFKAVTLPEKGTWYRVYLGEYAAKKEAQKTARLARERDRLKPVVIRSAAN